MTDLTDAHAALILRTASDLRKAIDQRNQMTADAIAEYDEAIRDGCDEDTLKLKAVLMLTMITLADPVRNVLIQYSQVSELLNAAEQA